MVGDVVLTADMDPKAIIALHELKAANKTPAFTSMASIRTSSVVEDNDSSEIDYTNQLH